MTKLFIANISSLDVDDASHRQRLSSERLTRLSAYRQKADQQRCLGAGLLLYHALGQPAEELASGSGRPYLANGPHFSISHSGEYVVLALANKGLVGCDIEQCKDHDFLRLGKRAFHEKEYKQLEQCANKAEAFYRLWTLRESFTKALSAGFSIDRTSFYFDLAHPSNVNLTDSQHLREKANAAAPEEQPRGLKESDLKELHFKEFLEPSTYYLAICSTERTEDPTWISL